MMNQGVSDSICLYCIQQLPFKANMHTVPHISSCHEVPTKAVGKTSIQISNVMNFSVSTVLTKVFALTEQ